MLGSHASAVPSAPAPDCVVARVVGRMLAWVWVGGTLVNEAMVRDGWAVCYAVPPNVKYADRIERAQNEARARRAGLWSSGGFACLPRDYCRGACIGSP